jgi:ABC-2 type transport system ATP-binding protein
MSASDEIILQCAGLTRRYRLGWRRWRKALRGVDLEVRAGEVFGLLGPNGAGKTTLLKILLGLLEADAGTCRLWGETSRRREHRARLGYVPEGPFFHRFATARQVLGYHWRLLGHGRRGEAEEIARVEKKAGLTGVLDQVISGYSKGMLQRLAVAQALLGDPDLLVLDEPTGGLDPVATVAFGRLIEELRDAGKTVLLCTHLLSQAERVCDRVAVLHRGRVVLSGEVGCLRATPGQVALRIKALPKSNRAEIEAAIAACGARVEAWEPVVESLETLFLRALDVEDWA